MRDSILRANLQARRHLQTSTPSPQLTFRNMPPDELAIRTAHQRKRLFELSCARGSTTACVTIEPMSGDQQRWCADLKLSSQDGLLVVRAEGLSPHDAVDRAFDELNVAAPAAA